MQNIFCRVIVLDGTVEPLPAIRAEHFPWLDAHGRWNVRVPSIVSNMFLVCEFLGVIQREQILRHIETPRSLDAYRCESPTHVHVDPPIPSPFVDQVDTRYGDRQAEFHTPGRHGSDLRSHRGGRGGDRHGLGSRARVGVSGTVRTPLRAPADGTEVTTSGS
jgi:hypothetical protein